ncbi:MAG: hypothetical protein PHH75_01520 [Candidatus Omnitrophica bacterium]|nr:hypothetical protein [Candidatus Omnitrophota bacterium]MDD5573838.1 hypothetical protein [Candidatus Omnitrophota bacterium]
MTTQAEKGKEVKRLLKRRETLRKKLKEHFSLSVQERNYDDFEKVVDELDELRKKLGLLRERGAYAEN